MSEHPNAIALRENLDKLQNGDLDGFLDAYADDSVYHVPGDNLVSGSYRGREAMRDFFIHLLQVTEGTMRLEIDDVLADDGHAVMFWHGTAQRAGRSLDADGAMAFKLDEDGHYVASWFLYSDQREYDAFYS